MREEEVFQAIADRVAALDYSDEVFVRPGHLDADGRWALTPSADDVRWLEERGSQTHLAAKAVGAVDPLPPLEPASAEAVADAERLLGHPLPPLLRRLYLEVANGGFGPGVLGVAGGYTDDLENGSRSAGPTRAAGPFSCRLLGMCDLLVRRLFRAVGDDVGLRSELGPGRAVVLPRGDLSHGVADPVAPWSAPPANACAGSADRRMAWRNRC